MSKIWKRGSMSFTDKWAKPPKLSMGDFIKTKDGRTWQSKAGELPSQFFARILSDMPEAVTNELFKEMIVRKAFGKTPSKIAEEIRKLEEGFDG